MNLDYNVNDIYMDNLFGDLILIENIQKSPPTITIRRLDFFSNTIISELITPSVLYQFTKLSSL